MLSRVYIDNFRSFVNFEYRPKRTELIMGSNGSGKSSLIDFVHLMGQFSMGINQLGAEDLTRWTGARNVVGELEATLGEDVYVYRLNIGLAGDPPTLLVEEESVRLNGRPIFEFGRGEVGFYNDQFVRIVTYGADARRSALASVGKGNEALTRFRDWVGSLHCFRINPFAIRRGTEQEHTGPFVDLANLAAWYRHLVQTEPRRNTAFIAGLQQALDGFQFLQFEPVGRASVLTAEFADDQLKSVRFDLPELSDGQRCLIALYMILHFGLARGGTVILDEPDNFVSLREIQPWLTAAERMVEDSGGQLLIVSHHPEIINQWATSSGVRFVREGARHVRVEQFQGDPDRCLAPAELVARGWDVQ